MAKIIILIKYLEHVAGDSFTGLLTEAATNAESIYGHAHNSNRTQ